MNDFSLKKVKWLHQDISLWEKTSKITNVHICKKGTITIDHTAKHQWSPAKEGIAGNPWIFIYRGKWYAASWEWLKHAQIKKFEAQKWNIKTLYERNTGPVNNQGLLGHTKAHPIKDRILVPGEVVGFMVSTLARSKLYGTNGKERSNIIWYKLPNFDGTGGGIVEEKKPDPPPPPKPPPKPTPPPPKKERVVKVGPMCPEKEKMTIWQWIKEFFGF